jgi:exodeoxyribonuclease VII large subunit
MDLDLEPAPDVLSVSDLNREARRLLERGLGTVWVEGELSNVSRPASGHMYWSLKDSGAQVRCAMFRQANSKLGFVPESGQHVLVRARVSLYEARGDYQLIIEELRQAGEGLLQRQFEALKRKLAAEGLFDAERKRALPAIPTRIGVITSPSGAAIRDVLIALGRRFPAIAVLIYPTSVQGDAAAAEIVHALQLAESRAECDLLIVTRGGGSLEDLWPFNEEIVARAIAAASIPIIVGVGHEVDFTIADFVADVRAPTPSQAAELAAPVQSDIELRLRSLAQQIARATHRQIDASAREHATLEHRLSRLHPQVGIQALQQRIDDLELHMIKALRQRMEQDRRGCARLTERMTFANPGRQLAASAERFAVAGKQIERGVRRLLEQLTARTALAERGLNALSPLATLERGFAIVSRRSDGAVVTSHRSVSAGAVLDIRVADGTLGAVVDDRLKQGKQTPPGQP